MRMYDRGLGRIPAVFLCCCLGVASACGEETNTESLPDAAPPPSTEIAVPLNTTLPPLAYTLQVNLLGSAEPLTITGHLHLAVDAEGRVNGMMSAKQFERSSVAALSGRVEGLSIVFEAGSISVLPDGMFEWSMFEWEQFRISLRDNDADGAADGAQGEVAGDWTSVDSDIVILDDHMSVLTAGLDTTPTTASFFIERSTSALMPFDPVRIAFEEPLAEADMRAALRILADGAPVTGELTFDAFNAAGGLAIGATFLPANFLPSDADLTIDLGNLQDPAGNTLIGANDLISVVADPGPLTVNSGFEDKLVGWSRLGQVSTQGPLLDLTPAEGAAQALVHENSTLAGYLDVPADANELDFSIAVLTDGKYVVEDYTTAIALHKPAGEKIKIFDAAQVSDQFQPCTGCSPDNRFQASVGPLRRTFDLTPYRGQRIYLALEARSSDPHFDVFYIAALIDDIQIR